jgi:hypothetical protein
MTYTSHNKRTVDDDKGDPTSGGENNKIVVIWMNVANLIAESLLSVAFHIQLLSYNSSLRPRSD